MMRVCSQNDFLHYAVRLLEAGGIRLLGYTPYFFLMVKLIALKESHLLAAISASLTFCLECCAISQALSYWHLRGTLRYAPLRGLTLFLAILLAMPTLGVGAIRLLINIDVAQSLQLFYMFLLPTLCFLVIQAFTRRCPYVSRRLAQAMDHPHSVARNAGTLPHHS